MGAMEEMSQTVQNANTHILRCQNHEHAHSSRSVQGSVQWGDGTFTWVRFAAKLTPCHTRTFGNGQHTSGAMDEMSGKFGYERLPPATP